MWKTDRREPQQDRAGRRELIDDLVGAYIGWREESRGLESSYGYWHRAVRRERRLAFAAYVAALDREERAAAVYRSFIERTAEPMSGAA